MRNRYVLSILTAMLLPLYGLSQSVFPFWEKKGKIVGDEAGIVLWKQPDLRTDSVSGRSVLAEKPGLIRLGQDRPAWERRNVPEPKSGNLSVSEKWNAAGKLFLHGYSEWQNGSQAKAGRLRQDLELRFGLCRRGMGQEKLSEDYVPVLIRFDQEEDLLAAESYGFVPQVRTEGLCSGLLPLASSDRISVIEGIRKINVYFKAEKDNDRIRSLSGVDKAQDAYDVNGLSRAYTGEGVVLGVIDMGFDYTHPAFFTDPADRSTYKVSRVWDQLASGGTPPSGTGIGVEYRGADAILSAEHDHHEGEHHGTHVAATAAGSGFGSDYRGVATGAELVLVSTTMAYNDILSGIRYIRDYAESVGKPSVINMSLGSVLGPHSGKTDLDRMFNQLVSPGHLLVGSAGNSGADSIHVGLGLGISEEYYFGLRFDDGSDNASIDVYDFQSGAMAAVLLVDLSTAMIEGSASFYTTEGYHEQEQHLDYEGETLVRIVAANSQEETYSNLLLDIRLEKELPEGFAVVMFFSHMFQEMSSRMHAWVEGASFSDFGKDYLRSGDCDYTHNGYLSVADDVLSVAAYTGRPGWTDMNGDSWTFGESEGTISSFSSRGPRVDGSRKPDIAAPGSAVISAANSFSEVPVQQLVEYTQVSGKEYPWMVLQGTSMSAPAVSGMVAMLLQQDADLDIDKLKGLLKETSVADDAVRQDGPNRWGYGKMDVLQALKTLEGGYDYADYYASARGKTGFELKTALYEIIRDHTVRTYDQLKTDMLATDSTLEGRVWDMYSSLSADWTWGAEATAEGQGINREHSFPKSWFGGEVEPMYTDLFHLYPTDVYANSMRSSLPFGEVYEATWEGSLSKVGSSRTSGYNAEVFEPADEYKGDFARTYFYMVTRYQDRIGQWMTPVLDGSTDYGLARWAVDLLLKWHREDPVGTKEQYRNEAVYAIQGNRNPFIDHPQWADEIWGRSRETAGETNDLIISEYVSGLRYGKPQRAIEIYNGTAFTVNMSEYCLKFETDGLGGYRDSLPLKGFVAPYSCFVVANDGTDDGKLLYADQFDQTLMRFNGNDAVALFRNGVLVDAVGVSGSAENWGQDKVLRRKLSVTESSATYDPQEWVSFNDELTGDFGSHGGGGYNPSSLAGAVVVDASTIRLEYTREVVLFAPGSDKGSFYLSGSDESAISVSSISISGRYLSMTLSEPMVAGISYTLTTGSFVDRWGHMTGRYTYPGLVFNDGTCRDIAELRTKEADGSTEYGLSEAAVVTAIGSQYNQKWIGDGSGAGIMIHDPSGLVTEDYRIGDRISGLKGTLSDYFGALQFTPVQDAVRETGNPQDVRARLLSPEPGFGDDRLKPLEGSLVKVAGCTFVQTGNFSDGSHYTADCQGKELPVRIHIYNTDLKNSPIPAGTVNVTGIVAARDNHYYVSPRFLADIAENIPVKCASLASLLEQDADDFTEYVLEGSCIIVAADPDQNRLWIQQDSSSVLVEYPKGLLTDTYAVGNLLHDLRGTLAYKSEGLPVYRLTADVEKDGTSLEPDDLHRVKVGSYSDLEAHPSAYVRLTGSYYFMDKGRFDRDSTYFISNGKEVQRINLYIHGTDLEGRDIPEGLLNISGVVVKDKDGLWGVAPRSTADIVPARKETVKVSVVLGDKPQVNLRAEMSFFDVVTKKLSTQSYVTDKNGCYVFEAYAGTPFSIRVEATDAFFTSTSEKGLTVEEGQTEFRLSLITAWIPYYGMESPRVEEEGDAVRLYPGEVTARGNLGFPLSQYLKIWKGLMSVGIHYTPEDLAFMNIREGDIVEEIYFWTCVLEGMDSPISYRITLYAGADRSEVIFDKEGETVFDGINSGIFFESVPYGKEIDIRKDLWLLIEFTKYPSNVYPYVFFQEVPFTGKNDLYVVDRGNPSLDLSLSSVLQEPSSVAAGLCFSHRGKLSSAYRFRTYAQSPDGSYSGPAVSFSPDSASILYPAWKSLPSGSYRWVLDALDNDENNLASAYSNTLEKESPEELCSVTVGQGNGGTVRVFLYDMEAEENKGEEIVLQKDVPWGTLLIMEARAEEGKRLLSWMDGSKEETRLYTVEGDVSVQAVFEDIPTYRLTLGQSEGGSIVASDPDTGDPLVSGNRYPEGLVLLSAEPAEGYRLRSWSFRDEPVSPVYFYLDRDTSVQALFVPEPVSGEEFRVDIRQNPGGRVRVYSGDVEVQSGSMLPSGSVLTVEAEPEPLYAVLAWWDEKPVESSTRTLVLDEDMELYASFERNAFRVNVASVEGGSIQMLRDGLSLVPGSTVEPGTVLELSASPASGYVFRQWWDGNVSAQRSLVVNTDLEISAEFRKNQYRLTIPSYEEGRITVTDYVAGTVYYDGDMVDPGTVLWMHAEPYTAQGGKSYRFVSWWDGDRINPRLYPIQGDLEVGAVFREALAYTVSIRQTEGGSVYVIDKENGDTVQSGDKYLEGSLFVLKAVEEEGYGFLQWWDGSTQAVRDGFALVSDVEISAGFSPEEDPEILYTVTVQQPENGEIRVWHGQNTVVSGSSLPANSILTLEAVADPGYAFSHWGDGDTLCRRNIRLEKDILLSAVFEKEIPKYLLTLYQTEGGTVSVEKEGEVLQNGSLVEEGCLLDLRAVPDPSYAFEKWWDGDRHPERKIEMTRNMVVQATFVYVPFEGRVVRILSAENGRIRVECEGEEVFSGDTLMRGSLLKITALADSGYVFDAWWDGNVQSPREYVLDSDLEISAVFKEKSGPEEEKFEVVIRQSEGGYVRAYLDEDRIYSGDKVEAGSLLRLVAEPDADYRLVEWWNGERDEEIYFVLKSDVEISAEFEREVAAAAVEEISFRLWPNPSAGLFHLEIFSGMHARIFSADGRLVSSCHWEDPGRKTLHLEGCTPGIYYLHLVKDDWHKTVKLIIR